MNREPSMCIAMWSGPRNISTAMMRAWGNRADTFVIDEPFYAYYLRQTRADHPGADEVVAHGETDWRKVVEHVTGPTPGGRRIFYQKQMTHHLLPDVSRDWLRHVTNCFLVRHPTEVIASYMKKNHEPALDDLGFRQQAEIFDFVCAETGKRPPVIDAHDVQQDPERTLRALCQELGVEFTDAMLSWPAGARATDGIWSKHWYAEVENSTGFRTGESQRREVPEQLREIYESCLAIYERLREHRL